jgi:hypothetical protein
MLKSADLVHSRVVRLVHSWSMLKLPVMVHSLDLLKSSLMVHSLNLAVKIVWGGSLAVVAKSRSLIHSGMMLNPFGWFTLSTC